MVIGPSMQSTQTYGSASAVWAVASNDDRTPRAIQPRRNMSESIIIFFGMRFWTASDIGTDAMKLTKKQTTHAAMPYAVGFTLMDPSRGKM